jgi:hypothetical protein
MSVLHLRGSAIGGGGSNDADAECVSRHILDLTSGQSIVARAQRVVVILFAEPSLARRTAVIVYSVDARLLVPLLMCVWLVSWSCVFNVSRCRPIVLDGCSRFDRVRTLDPSVGSQRLRVVPRTRPLASAFCGIVWTCLERIACLLAAKMRVVGDSFLAHVEVCTTVPWCLQAVT